MKAMTAKEKLPVRATAATASVIPTEGALEITFRRGHDDARETRLLRQPGTQAIRVAEYHGFATRGFMAQRLGQCIPADPGHGCPGGKRSTLETTATTRNDSAPRLHASSPLV